MTAISWFNNKKAFSRKRNNDIRKSEIFLNVLSSKVDKISVRHWSNKIGGEIPADFGNKGKNKGRHK